MSAEIAVRLAITCAGQLDDGWETRVNTLVPMIAGMLREQSDTMSVASEVLGSKIIFGEYRGKALEESSQRLIVSFMADNGDAVETMRTRRLDEPAGHAMDLRLKSIQPGDRCAFFKHMDVLGPKSSARLLVNIERQPLKAARSQPPPQRRADASTVRPAGGPAVTPAEAPVRNESPAVVLRALLATLNEEQRLKAVELLKRHGWSGADDIPEDQFEKALYIVRYQREDYF